MKRLRKRLPFALTFLLFVPTLLHAQIPSIAEIPSSLGPIERYHALLQERISLVDRRAALMSRVSAHNSQCRQVPEDSPQAQTCRDARTSLESDKSSYVDAVNRFNRKLQEANTDWQAQHNQLGPRIGGAANVVGEVFTRKPGGEFLPLREGDGVFLNAEIVTKAGAKLKVLLQDGSVFSLGQDSDFILDEFVYDPNTNAGKITANITKGVFRFVTGKMAHKQTGDMHIRIPTGCLGIRGTDVEVSIASDNSGYVKLYSGELEMMDHKTGATVLLHRGQMVTLSADGAGQPAPVTPE